MLVLAEFFVKYKLIPNDKLLFISCFLEFNSKQIIKNF